MTKNGIDYNYTFCNTSTIGQYVVYGLGDINGLPTIWSYYFSITSTGSSQTTAEGLGGLAYIGVMIFLMGLFGWLGFKFSETKTLWVLGVLFIVFSLLLLGYVMWLSIEYRTNFTGANNNSGMAETLFFIFTIIIYGGLISWGIYGIVNYKKIFEWFKSAVKSKDKGDDWDLGNYEKM
jgi:hypothetical protein